MPIMANTYTASAKTNAIATPIIFNIISDP